MAKGRCHLPLAGGSRDCSATNPRNKAQGARVVGRGSWVVGRGSWVVGRGSWVVGRIPKLLVAVVALRQPLEIGHFRPRTKVAERRDDGSQGLQPLDPVRVSGASRRDAGIDCRRFASISLKGRTSLRDANLKTHANRGRCPRLPSSCRSATPENRYNGVASTLLTID
jgi:hypothetical protein